MHLRVLFAATLPFFSFSIASATANLHLQARQEPEYFDGYAYLTPDEFSIDVLPALSSSSSSYQEAQLNQLNISTAYGYKLYTFQCPCLSSNDTSSNSTSTHWLTFTGPTVPGSQGQAEPVLQSAVDLGLVPGEGFCGQSNEVDGVEDGEGKELGEGTGQGLFNGVSLRYDGTQFDVSTNTDDCRTWSGEGGEVSEDGTGSVMRCVLPLTPE